MTTRPRLKLRSLMLLVAATAVGCAVVPPWWRWHHEMLERTNAYLVWADIAEGWIDWPTDRPSPEWVHDTGRRQEMAARFREAAMFPWLDPPE